MINFLATGLTAMVQSIKGVNLDLTELLVCSLIAQCFVLVYSSIILPVNMRYGTEKGRIILIVMAVAMGGILGGSGSLLEAENSNVVLLVNGLNAFGMVEMLFLMVIICGVINVVSYFVCVKWMQKKEY